MAILSPQQNQIVSLVSKYGCADINQIYAYMSDLKPKAVQILINSLIRANILTLRNDRYLVPKGNENLLDMDTIDCIWAMLKLTSNKDDIAASIPGTDPAKIMVVVNNQHSFEIISVNEVQTSILRRAQEKMANKFVSTRKLSFNWMVFVAQSKRTVSLIKACEFNFPYMVVYIEEFDKNRIPKMKLYRHVPENNAETE